MMLIVAYKHIICVLRCGNPSARLVRLKQQPTFSPAVAARKVDNSWRHFNVTAGISAIRSTAENTTENAQPSPLGALIQYEHSRVQCYQSQTLARWLARGGSNKRNPYEPNQ